MNMSAQEVKDKLVEKFREWLNKPGNIRSMTTSIELLQDPQGQPAGMVITMKGETQYAQALVHEDRPLIVPANGVLRTPPG